MRFMVESSLKQAPTPEVLALIPAETARGKELDAQGIRVKLYVAADQSRVWQLFQSESQAAVQAALASLPLHSYVNTTITLLAEDQ